ncbi:DUF3427 domain-containing protein [Schaalia sp. 19OD2882]|uniref:DUF3427 domain-containing protein n=1 Tax=Schaalia sp. 19OD2882 TaxID=2794089 RepID=UPI001C1EC9C7|nr:DUF3427 domain-containing protein [Schaalia sp. 19OD2882]QWW19476.1 DUF3427 domain-containing protein [Schaalia sp. 19OD2882]
MTTELKLMPGVYQTPLTRRMDAAIRANTQLTAGTDEIPTPLLPASLTHLVSTELKQALAVLSPQDQVALVNRLLAMLPPTAIGTTEDLALVTSAKQPALELRSLTDDPLREAPRHPWIRLTDAALITNAPTEPALAHILRDELATADRVDLLCAFVKWSGMRLLSEAFAELRDRDVPFRILTTTYMGATERRALETLARKYRAQIKISYDIAATRLHAKSWILHRNSGFDTAFVGSSNLSRAAMLDGLEWNVRIASSTTPDLFQKLTQTFESYWHRPVFEEYDPEQDADRLDQSLQSANGHGDVLDLDTSFLAIEPQPHQRIMLADLAHERQQGRHRNLVVAATGTGKTVLAALDYRALCGGTPHKRSLLFVAHRKEILQQARATYRRVLADSTFGELLIDGRQPNRWKHVFASVQSLTEGMLKKLRSNLFDIMVIDEFHHAEAPTYQRILKHFHPQELLGLTATPERADGVDVASRFFEGRVASELRLWDALEGDLLVPFHYFGISDSSDLRELDFRRGSYDVEQLEKLYLENDARSELILKAIEEHIATPQHMRALAFCVSVKHAKYMSHVLNRAGLRSTHLNGTTGPGERERALADLRCGRLACICTVDLFNEGLDIPSIDTILMLRPTQSATIFLQQLGRGLRRAPEKSVLTVLDFVGHQSQQFSFEPKFRALTGLGRKALLEAAEQGFPQLPPGCGIHLDRVAQKIVLNNIRAQTVVRLPQLAQDLRNYANRSGDPTNYSLTRWLIEMDADLSILYGRTYQSKPLDWERIRHLALLTPSIGESPTAIHLRSRVRVFAHVNDPLRAGLYSALALGTCGSIADWSAEQRSAAHMLFYNIWPDRKNPETGARFSSLEEGLSLLHHHRWFGEQISEVMAHTVARSRSVFGEPGGNLSDTVLLTHAAYRREELLAGVGLGEDFAASSVPGTVREGVYFQPRRSVDALMVNLHKDSAKFSESTRYQDYALTEDLFHWQSQNQTSPESATGLRYQGLSGVASDIALFVRADETDEFGKGAPYTFLGLADFVSTHGTRPMSITWHLRTPMPQELYLEARAAAS